jgi:aspartokinase-like uncharacterized kinase
MRRVIKIGGSLLPQDSLAETIQSWTDAQPPAETVAIVGGGELIDAVRRLDDAHGFDPAWVHWHCVGLLRTTFRWLGDQLLGWQLHATDRQFEELRMRQPRTGSPTRSERCHLVAVDSFYHVGKESPLPEDWTTTTDAIAGWLAVLLDADELVLLKSCDVDDSVSLAELADQGVVDGALPMFADQLRRVRFVNFRREIFR